MAKRKTNEEFLKELDEIWKGQLIALTSYGRNMSEKVLIRCNNCDNEFSASPMHLLAKKPTGCPECAKNKRKKKLTLTKEQILEKVKNEDKDYEIIDWLEYKTTRDKVIFKHKSCGNTFDMTVNNFLSGQRCPKHRGEHKGCFKNKDHNHYIQKMSLAHDYNEYKVLEQIESANKKFKILHKKCNHTYLVSAQKFIDGRRCPNCANIINSKPIKQIKLYLEEHGIEFESEKSFDDLRSPITNYKLRFDIYLPDFNSIIEYDGEFHDQVIKSKNNKEKLRKQKLYDAIKNKYCQDNKIKLYRINYREKDKIKDILDSIF